LILYSVDSISYHLSFLVCKRNQDPPRHSFLAENQHSHCESPYDSMTNPFRQIISFMSICDVPRLGALSGLGVAVGTFCGPGRSGCPGFGFQRTVILNAGFILRFLSLTSHSLSIRLKPALVYSF